MKKIVLLFSLLVSSMLFAQEEINITNTNSWFKAGITAGIPVGDANDASSFALGLDARGQYLVSPNFAIGIASGYTHYFGKDDIDDFGTVPVAGFARYYFTKSGVFIGSDFGYSFLTNIENNAGGLYVNPQIGYHNRDWNIYGYFQNTFAENDVKVQNVGIGATYNIRF
jgi:hypothetical protein